MRCSDARNLLTQRLREPLPPDDELRLEQHLVACGPCRAEAEELLRLEKLLRTPSAQQPVPIVHVDTAAITQFGRRSPVRPARAVAGLVGAMGATAAVILYAGHEPQRPTVEKPSRRGMLSESADPALGKVSALPAIGPELKLPSPPERPVKRQRQPHERVPERKLTGSATPPGRPEASPLARKLHQVTRAMSEKPEVGMVIRFSRKADAPEDEPVFAPPPRPGAVLAVAFEPAAAGAAATGKVDGVLQGDPRLQARLTLAEVDRPLGELLPAVGKRLQVRLVADRTVSDDKATLHFQNRPAAEVLTLLARHLGFRWYTTRGGFELAQDVAAKRREQTLQRNELQPIEAQLALAARLLEHPQNELRPRFDAIEAALKSEQLQPDERARLLAEKQTTLDVMLSRSTVEAALGVFRSLNPAQIDALLAGSEFRFSTANETLPPALAEKIHDSTSILETIRGPQPRLQADANVRLTDVEDDDSVPPPRRNRQLRLFCTTTSLRGTRQDPHNWGTNWSPKLPDVTTGMPGASRNAADPELDREVDLTLPGPVKQPLAILGGGLLSAAHLGAVWPRQATVGEIGSAIHRATGLEVVADSFISARLDPALLRGKRPLREVLDTVARELDYAWEKRGRLLLFRNRLFFRDRPAEVPPRLLQGFRARVLREGALSLDELSGLAASLTDPQVRGMYRYWGWYLEGSGILPPEWLFAYRHHLRFWAGLALPQKQRVRTGGRLAVAQFTPAQQQLWVAALMSPPESARTPTSEQRNPTLAEMASGGFSLATHEVQAMLFVKTLPDGKGRVATGINVEGPPTTDVRKFHHSDDPEFAAQPQLSLQGLTFYYHVGENRKLERKARILIAPLQRADEPMNR